MVGTTGSPNTGLTPLFAPAYAAFNRISREKLGMLYAVSLDAKDAAVALNEPIRSPIVPSMAVEDIQPNNVAPTGTEQAVEHVDLTITKQRKASFHLTNEEEYGLMTSGLAMDVTTQRFMQAFRAITNEIEDDLAGLYVNATGGVYGTPGTSPFQTRDELDDLTQTKRMLDDIGAPDDRSMVFSNEHAAQLTGKQPALFKANEAGEVMTRMSGSLPRLFGFDLLQSGQIDQHVRGSAAALTVNNGAGYAVGAKEIAFDAGSNGESLNKGDLVTIAGDSTTHIVEALTGATSGTLVLRTHRGLRSAVADDAAITALAQYTPSIALSRDAIQLATRLPASSMLGDMAMDRTNITDPYTGLTFEMSMYGQYRQVSIEVALCWGFEVVKPEHMALLVG